MLGFSSTCVISVNLKLIKCVFDYYYMIILCFVDSKVSLL